MTSSGINNGEAGTAAAATAATAAAATAAIAATAESNGTLEKDGVTSPALAVQDTTMERGDDGCVDSGGDPAAGLGT